MINKITERLGLLLLTLLISGTAISSPKIIIKDQENSQFLSIKAIPESISKIIQNIEIKDPSLYEIIVHKFSSHYTLYLLSGKTWGAKKVRIDIDKSGRVQQVINDFTGSDPILIKSQPTCPDPTIQFVAISAYPGVASVNEAMETVTKAAKTKFKTMTILSTDADGSVYKNWLSCPNLKGFYSIGHGSESEIIVGKGDVIDSTFFHDPIFTNKFKDTTVIINSCLVYNFPFGIEIMFGNTMKESDYQKNPGPNAYEFIGGHTALLMNSSERSSSCFIAKAIEGAAMDYDTLKECIGSQNIHYQNFGISQLGRKLT